MIGVDKFFSSKKIELVFLWVPVFFALLIIGFTLWTFNKGLTMIDEAWYLYLIKDNPQGATSSNFFKFLGNAFNGDIYITRVFTFAMVSIGKIVFAWGLYKYFKDSFALKPRDYILILTFLFIGFSVFGIKINFVFSYLNMNSFLLMCSLGFLLIAFARQNAASMILYYVSGFLIGLVIFIMITNAPIIGLLGILILLVSKKRLAGFGLYAAGVVSSVVFYFVFIEPFSVFFAYEFLPNIETVHKAGYAKGYGIRPMIYWGYFAFEQIVLYAFGGALMVLGLTKFSSTYNIHKFTSSVWFYGFSLALMFSLFFISNVVFNQQKIAPFIPFMILFLLLVFEYVKAQKETGKPKDHIFFGNIALFVFLFIIPVFLSLGTNVPFIIRGGSYIAFLLPIIFLLSVKCLKKQHYYYVFVVIIGVFMARFVTTPNQSNWAGLIYTHQTEHVRDLGINQNIKLDKNHYENLSELRRFVNAGDPVVFSSIFMWGYPYLLDMRPISYSFRFNKANIFRNLHSEAHTLSKLFLLEDKSEPFFEGFFDELNASFQLTVEPVLVLEDLSLYVAYPKDKKQD